MSRVGKQPVPVPAKTKTTWLDQKITVQGPNGSLSRKIHPNVDVEVKAGVIEVTVREETRNNRALQGLTRSLINNMVVGVNEGFERVLEINGIGYRAELKGNAIIFNVGFSNPVTFGLPEGISASIERNTTVKLTGIDKEKLGLTAAAIRKIRPPEPYKGKGIKYAEEYVRRKAGKAGVAAQQ